MTDIAAAEREVERARAQLAATAEQLRDRLAPRRLVSEALESAGATGANLIERGERTVRQQPRLAAYVGLAAFAIIVRRPVLRLVRRVFGGRRERREGDERETVRGHIG